MYVEINTYIHEGIPGLFTDPSAYINVSNSSTTYLRPYHVDLHAYRDKYIYSRGDTWVGVCEQGADGEQNFGCGEGRAPVILSPNFQNSSSVHLHDLHIQKSRARRELKSANISAYRGGFNPISLSRIVP